MKSTSGVYLCIQGPRSCFPLAGISRKQGAVSHSTPEAEIVAADVAVRLEGIPALPLWDLLLGLPQCILFHEDN